MQISLNLKPFLTPNFVVPEMPPSLRESGVQFMDGIPLKEVDAETLAALCDQFRATVFKKAGKTDPSK